MGEWVAPFLVKSQEPEYLCWLRELNNIDYKITIKVFLQHLCINKL